jgi:hypothetical protein
VLIFTRSGNDTTEKNQTWRTLLGQIIADPEERHRIANAIRHHHKHQHSGLSKAETWDALNIFKEP